mgnify:CR=1 FL=1
MLRELVSNNIYVFTSELYAQVTAGAILTSAGAVVIDTMPFPVETRQIIHFIEERHNTPIRYVINTHYHADHTFGTCFFSGAQVISHRLCREMLERHGQAAIEQARRGSRELAALELRLPDLVFDNGGLSLHIGGVTLNLRHAPGHSHDSIVCQVEEERVLFAADALTPVPFFSDGSWTMFVQTLQCLRDEPYECIIQGHGEVVLRGEVQSRIQEDLDYLHCIREHAERVVSQGDGPDALSRVDIEQCHKSRIALNGLGPQLHRSNLETLYNRLLSGDEL